MLELKADLASSSDRPACLALVKNACSISMPMLSPVGHELVSFRKWRRSEEKEHTTLEINQTTAVKLDVSHRDPGCDTGGVTVSQEDLIVMNLVSLS